MAGFSIQRLARVGQVLSGHVSSGAVPGLVALVERHGHTHVEALGAMSLGGPPVDRDAIFRIASMTKPITAAAAMTLVEECALRLDEPVDPWLPELADRRVLTRLDAPLTDTVPALRPITLRDLLTFRLGFGQVFVDPADSPVVAAAIEAQIGMGPPAPATTPAPDEWIRRLGALPLMAQPGHQWLYHTGSDVLGVLLSRVCGKSLGEVLSERVFDPLGMVDTGFSVPAESMSRFTTLYSPDPATGALAVFDGVDGQWSAPPPFESGGGGLVSTVDDVAAFSRMMLGYGRHSAGRLLSRSSVEVMTTDQLTPNQKVLTAWVPEQFESHGWGFGVTVVTRHVDGAAPVGSYGWDGGLGSSWRNDPGHGLLTVLLTNATWTSPRPPAVHLDLRTCAYAALDD